MIDETRLEKIRDKMDYWRNGLAGIREGQLYFCGQNPKMLCSGTTAVFVSGLISDIEYLLKVIHEMELSAAWKLQEQINRQGEWAAEEFKKMLDPVDTIEFVGCQDQSEEQQEEPAWLLTHDEIKDIPHNITSFTGNEHPDKEKVTVALPKQFYDLMVEAVHNDQDIKIVCEEEK